MKKTILAILLALALVLIPVSSAFAAKTEEVTINATPGYISITSVPDTYDFGIVDEGATENTTATPLNIDNVSKRAIDITIVCDGWASGAGSKWTYGASDNDTGQLNFSITGGAPWTLVPDAVAVEIVDNLAADTDQTYDLQLEAPSVMTFGDEQETLITLTAAKHT
jgi:hypothetical protein